MRSYLEKCGQEADEGKAGQDGHGVGRQGVRSSQDGVHCDDDDGGIWIVKLFWAQKDLWYIRPLKDTIKVRNGQKFQNFDKFVKNFGKIVPEFSFAACWRSTNVTCTKFEVWTDQYCVQTQ